MVEKVLINILGFVRTNLNFFVSILSVQHDVLHDAGFKESPFKPGPGSANDTKIASMVKDLQGMINQEITGEFASMVCRSIRVGSYKSLIKERVFFTQKGIFIKMPYLTDSKCFNF